MEDTNQQSLSPQPVNSMPPAVNSGKSKVIPIILGVTVAIVIAIGAYVFGTKQSQPANQQPTTTSSTIVQPSSTPSPIPTLPPLVIPTTDPSITANWKTYKNEEYGFVIKYPNNLSLEEHNNYISLELWGPTQRTQQGFHDGIQLNFLTGTLEGKTLKEFVDAEVKKTEDSKGSSQVAEYSRKIIIGEKDGYIYKVIGAGPFSKIYLSPKPNIYFLIIDGTVDPNNKGFKEIVDQILSTFKFTDQNSSILDSELKYLIPQGFKKEILETEIILISPDYIPGVLADTEKGIKITINKYSTKDFPKTCAITDTAGVSDPISTSVGSLSGFRQTIGFEGYQIRYCVTSNSNVWDIRFLMNKSDQNKFENVINIFLSSFKFTSQ